MNTEKRIEQCLEAAPKPSASDGLLNKLQNDITSGGIKAQPSFLRKWLAPAGGPISAWRVAAVATIAVMVLLPLTYAGGKVIKNYVLEEVFEVVETVETEEGRVTKVATVSVVSVAPDEPPKEEEIREMDELKKAGKFEKEFVKEWAKDGMTFRLYKVSYTLSSGKVVTRNEIEGGSDK